MARAPGGRGAVSKRWVFGTKRGQFEAVSGCSVIGQLRSKCTRPAEIAVDMSRRAGRRDGAGLVIPHGNTAAVVSRRDGAGLVIPRSVTTAAASRCVLANCEASWRSGATMVSPSCRRRCQARRPGAATFPAVVCGRVNAAGPSSATDRHDGDSCGNGVDRRRCRRSLPSRADPGDGKPALAIYQPARSARLTTGTRAPFASVDGL